MKGSDVVAESPADATRWRLLKGFLFAQVLKSDTLLSVSVWEDKLVKLYYTQADEKEACRELEWPQWQRLMDEEETVPLDELLGAVPFTDLKAIDTAEKEAMAQMVRETELCTDPVAALVPEVKQPMVSTPVYALNIGDRCTGNGSGRRGTVLARALNMGYITYEVEWDTTGIQKGLTEDSISFLDDKPAEPRVAADQLHEVPLPIKEIAAASRGQIIIGRPGASAIVGMDKPGRPAAPKAKVESTLKFKKGQIVYHVLTGNPGTIQLGGWVDGSNRYKVMWGQNRPVDGVLEADLTADKPAPLVLDYSEMEFYLKRLRAIYNQNAHLVLIGPGEVEYTIRYSRPSDSKYKHHTFPARYWHYLFMVHGAWNRKVAGLPNEPMSKAARASLFPNLPELPEVIDQGYVIREKQQAIADGLLAMRERQLRNEPEEVLDAPAPEPTPEPVAVVAEPITAYQFKVGERVKSLTTGKVGRTYSRDDGSAMQHNRITYGVAWDGMMAMQANCPEEQLTWEAGYPKLGRVLAEVLFENVMAGNVYHLRKDWNEDTNKFLYWASSRYGELIGMCSQQDVDECVKFPCFQQKFATVLVGTDKPTYEVRPMAEKRGRKSAKALEPEPEAVALPTDEEASAARATAAVDAIMQAALNADPNALIVVVPPVTASKPADPIALAKQAKEKPALGSSERISVRTVAGTGSAGLTALMDAGKPEKLAPAGPQVCPEAQLAGGVQVQGFYYLADDTTPYPTLIQAVLGVGQLWKAKEVANEDANDANIYEEVDMPVVFNTALAWFLGRLIGANLKYAGDDEEVPDEVFDQFRDAVLGSPEPITLADLRTYVDMWAEETGRATQDRCELLMRLLRLCERHKALYKGSKTNRSTVQALEMGFSCDSSTPGGYALHTSVNKAKPLFSKVETRVLSKLLEAFGS